MKNIFVVILLISTGAASAQQIRRCSSVEYLQSLEENNPAISARRAASEAMQREWISSHDLGGQQVVDIPIVFHILYNDSAENLPDSVVLSQLDVINEDYRRLNADSTQTPLAFRAVAADCDIQFCLAQRTPADLSTTGIIHKFTAVNGFSNFNDPKLSANGGDDVWDPTRYLNVWVADFTIPNFLGMGTFPNTDTIHDGILINYKVCGRIGSQLIAHYNRGRSLTHEIGHWLNLQHTWGDDGGTCDGDDQVADTPPQASETYGCPAYPKTDSCSPSFPGIMFMNYLDYTDDECMNIFTQGQKARMVATLNTDRVSILSSNACVAVGINEYDLRNYFTVYPNPAQDKVFIKSSVRGQELMEIYVLNAMGQILMKISPAVQNSSLKTQTVDLGDLAPGIYFLQLISEKGNGTFRIVKE